MAYQVSKVNYCYVTVPSRAGQGEKILNELREAGIDLLAFSGFPLKGGKSQVDLVSGDTAAIRRVARDKGWKLSDTKKGFLVRGSDEIGAVHRVIKRLSDEKINVTAADAVTAGNGRFGMIMWVKQKDYNRAARILNAK
ncbi:MAG: hypothetical protein A2W28_12810 [Gammaproteobacteria bacterium RBG_16_51_14]|nr:MAG: hypothetical protein A2W28_12810 [Gammaproteobacteria bacterium RBG_16_51_14]